MINTLFTDQPIVDENGKMTQVMRTQAAQVTEESLIIGSGSPEGVEEGNQGRRFMDEAGLAGSIYFIKQVSDVGGDATQGWVAIG